MLHTEERQYPLLKCLAYFAETYGEAVVVKLYLPRAAALVRVWGWGGGGEGGRVRRMEREAVVVKLYLPRAAALVRVCRWWEGEGACIVQRCVTGSLCSI